MSTEFLLYGNNLQQFPSPKIAKTLNNYRPVALISLVMNSLEKLITEVLGRTVPLQSAYQTNRGLQDALLYNIYLYYNNSTQLQIQALVQGSKNYARLLFVDFSSAFNTIQPHLLVQKLTERFVLNS